MKDWGVKIDEGKGMEGSGGETEEKMERRSEGFGRKAEGFLGGTGERR